MARTNGTDRAAVARPDPVGVLGGRAMKVVALACMALAAAVLGGGVVADAYPPSALTVSVSPSTVEPGGSVTVTIEGCVQGDELTVTLEAVTATVSCEGTAGAAFLLGLAPSSGAAEATVTAPGVAGTYTGTVRGPESGEATFTVTVAGGPGDRSVAGTLPSTGVGGIDATMAIAVGLFVVGFGLFVVSRVRRRAAA